MGLRPEELAKTIDHTLASGKASPADVERLCVQAQEHHFASVSVPPEHVTLAAEHLRGADVKVSAVIGFPNGAESIREKVEAAIGSLEDGAGELELVTNAPALAGGDFRLVRDELVALERAVRMRSVNAGRGAVLLKIAIDAAALSDKAKRLACRIVESAGADFVAVAACADDGFDGFHDVELLREYLSERVGVKAVGEIKTLEQAYALVNAGAGRIGTPAAVGIMQAKGVHEPSAH